MMERFRFWLSLKIIYVGFSVMPREKMRNLSNGLQELAAHTETARGLRWEEIAAARCRTSV